MPIIVIANWGKKTLQVNGPEKTLLQHLHGHSLDWMHACGGKGRCTTCKAIIVHGPGNFAPLTPAEHRYRAMGALSQNERLACQAKVRGDVTIAVPDECKFPHVDYR